MSNLNGWGLTARLISKHFGNLGDTLAEAIASFDPETATEADRDRLQASLMQAAQKLASARTAFNKENEDVTKLKELIANDGKVAETLAARLQSGSISEATVTLFCDELEANKARLPVEEQEAANAKSFMDEIQKIVDAMSTQLADFDRRAKAAKQALANAQAQRDVQAMKLERQAELDSLNKLGGHSSALSALAKKADKVASEAAGMKIVADINQAPLDRAAELDSLRKSVNAAPVESALERLKRLSAQNA